MRKRVVILLLSIFIVLSITGCKSLFTEEGGYYRAAKTAANGHNYGSGLINVSNALSIDPEYKKAILLLEEIYPEGLQYYQRELVKIEGREDLSSLDLRVYLYEGLEAMAQGVRILPSLIHPKTELPLTFELFDFSFELTEAKEGAAEGYYQEGLKFSALDGRDNQKAASKAFKKCLSYVSGYKDAERLEQNAREEAIQALVFLPLQGEDFSYRTFDIKELLVNNIKTELNEDPEIREYTRIIEQSLISEIIEMTKQQSTGLFDDATSIEVGKLASANIIFTGRVDRISVDYPEYRYEDYYREAEVDAVFDDFGREPLEDEMVSVSSYITIYEKESSAHMTVTFKMIDIETATIIQSGTYEADESDLVSWAEFDGDERALSATDSSLVDEYEQDVMTAEELLTICVGEIADDIAFAMKRYLR